MRIAGFNYADPFGPPADPRFAGALSPTEITVAKSDVACKKQANLVGAWSGVESEIQRGLISEHSADLEKIRQANEAQLRFVVTLG
ncbi:hypothetical protein [Parafrankia sp. EUN1f]|uniref:hypothetical protein n=1 Tax=Parafrankia sp. EUN1f TaxID=102897 RepID=UPI0002DCA81C|nr:hypothetical protein [Parafrankia sp. EUN1f]